MTEFKYCVHCENEPAVCFNTEVEAMKFARECADTCSCVKVEKSELDEDGEILNIANSTQVCVDIQKRLSMYELPSGFYRALKAKYEN